MRKLLIYCCLCCPFVLFGQNDVEELITLFEQKKYPETLQQAKVKRNRARASDLAAIDLIIACSYCMSEEDPRRGKAVLDKIANNYRLNRAQERSVQEIRAACGSPTAAVQLPELDVVKAVRDMGQVAVRGGSAKSGWEISLASGDELIIIDPQENPTSPPTHDRAFARAEGQAAMAYFNDLYANTSARRTLSEHFLIYSLSRISQSKLDNLGQYLDRQMRAYAQAYEFEIPDGLITLHIVPNNTGMNRLSRALYGFEMGTDNRGYSEINNRSMLVKIEDPHEYRGTLLHELMHILVNYNATLPPWLSEGFPALFEATTDNGMRGVGNWRYHVLGNVLPLRESARKRYLSPGLFEYNWADFDAQSYNSFDQLVIDRLRQAANHASARYFVFYLQERGWLPDMVRAFADFHYGSESFEQYANNTELIEAVTGQPMDELWPAYIRWLGSLE